MDSSALLLAYIAIAILPFVVIWYYSRRFIPRGVGGGLWRIFSKVANRVGGAAAAGAHAAGQKVAHAASSRSARILAPGDSAPRPDRMTDYWDYRGVARERDVRGLTKGQVRLGRYLHPRGRPGAELWLPASLLTQGCAVVGPPGSGKTENTIIPWTMQLLEAGSSVVVIDVKGDLIDALAPAARQLGRVWYWNAGDVARSQSWNWLSGVTDVRDIEAAAQSIIGRKNPNDPQPYFYERDYRWLRALISVTSIARGRHAVPRDLYTLVADQDALHDVFANVPATRQHATEVADLLNLPPDEHSRAVSGLLNALHLFNTPQVVQVTERTDFQLQGLGTQPTLLIVGASLADGRFAEVLSSIMISRLFSLVYRRFGISGAGAPLPMVFLLDEAARLRERIDFEEVLSVARSADVGICLAMQNVGQFGDEREAAAVLDNCRSFIVLRGCSPDTAKYFGARLGQRVEKIESATRPHRRWTEIPRWDRSAQSASVPVLADREIMHPPMGQYIGIAQVAPVSSSPFLIQLVGSGAS